MKYCSNFGLVFEDLILKTSCIALHLHYNYIFMHLDVYYICSINCVLVGFDWVEPMMYLLCMSHVHAFSMHLYVFSHFLTIVNCFGAFLIVSFFPVSIFLVTLVVSMAPKRKSTLTWNPLHSSASTSSDHAPLSLRFRNDDAHKAFTENFSRQGIHLEC